MNNYGIPDEKWRRRKKKAFSVFRTFSQGKKTGKLKSVTLKGCGESKSVTVIKWTECSLIISG